MTQQELLQMVAGFRARCRNGQIDFREKALVRETVEALCEKNQFPLPWTRQENCAFIVETIKYWGSVHCSSPILNR